MELTIDREFENPLLDRKEVWFTITYDGGTPKRQEVREKIAAVLAINEKLLIIDHIKQKYGKEEATGFAKIYKSEDALRDVEPKYKIERNIVGGESGKEEKEK